MRNAKLARLGILIPAALLSALLGMQLAPTGAGTAPDPGGTGLESTAKPNRYVGAAKCKNCHRAEEAGNQYGAWEESKHAHAYETLKTPEAKAQAKERGIEDPLKADECLRCHVTGHGEPEEHFRKGFDIEQGVQCETCHGPGEQHMKARLMAAAAAARNPDADEGYVQVPEGEIVSTVGQDTCLECHNEESPSFQSFCYYLRAEQVRHLNPLKPRTEEELAAFLVCGCGDSCECTHGSEEGCGVPPEKKE